jgi:hypothetical protein
MALGQKLPQIGKINIKNLFLCNEQDKYHFNLFSKRTFLLVKISLDVGTGLM